MCYKCGGWTKDGWCPACECQHCGEDDNSCKCDDRGNSYAKVIARMQKRMRERNSE